MPEEPAPGPISLLSVSRSLCIFQSQSLFDPVSLCVSPSLFLYLCRFPVFVLQLCVCVCVCVCLSVSLLQGVVFLCACACFCVCVCVFACVCVSLSVSVYV